MIIMENVLKNNFFDSKLINSNKEDKGSNE